MRLDRTHFLVALIAALATLVAPVAAREVADFARNAGRVDGFSAVAPDASRRANRLVATNERGRLPGNLIGKVRRAKEAERLDGLGPSAFVRQCQGGGLRGQAHVTPDVGAEMQEVPGFSTSYGGPFNRDGSNCHFGPATARRVGTGIYDVHLSVIAWDCAQPLPSDLATAVVTVQGEGPLVATYEPVCDERVYVRVRIFELNGTPRDAPFSIGMLASGGLPIP